VCRDALCWIEEAAVLALFFFFGLSIRQSTTSLVVSGEWRTLRRGWFLTATSASLAGLAVGIMVYSGDMHPGDTRYRWAHALGWHVPLALAVSAVSWMYPGAECQKCHWIHHELVKLHEQTEILKALALARQRAQVSRGDYLSHLDQLLTEFNEEQWAEGEDLTLLHEITQQLKESVRKASLELRAQSDEATRTIS
jgi:hypothetical protein